MGLLKKITKPISKVLDKIIPNEIKPALPFLSAAAPFMLPTGIMGTSMLQRALMSGGINLASQLAQEGSEGEFDPLSLAIASGIGALSAPGTPSTVGGPANMYGTPGTPGAEKFLMGKAEAMDPGWMKSGTQMLGKGAKYLTKAGQTLRDTPFSKEGLKASIVPFSQGLADSAMISAQQALDEFNAGLEEGSEAWYDDDARRIAIRRAMEMAGHVEDDILSALAALGLKEGGRVNKKGGGILEIEFKEMANGGMTSVLPKGQEMDYRGGGMIPMGSKERADDVPARLSKNEFVMTADAVRAAGGGSVNVGAKRMYDLMHNLEARV